MNDFRFAPSHDLLTVDSPLYRPPSFPPPDDWVVSVDSEGAALSLYGEDFWDYRAFERSATFNFSKDNMSVENKLLVKKIIHLVLYNNRLFPGKIRSCSSAFSCLVKIAKVCDSKGVLMSRLQRFQAIHQEVADALQCSSYAVYLNLLHRLRIHAGILGFELFDEKGMAFLASQQGVHDPVQTPYIPPRIWAYQLHRLSECLDDFLEHQKALEKAFSLIAESYKNNAALLSADSRYCSPFNNPVFTDKGRRMVFNGGLEGFLVEYGLSELIDKWLGKPREQLRISRMTAYLNMVREASIFYIMSFSLQRISEAASLRSDCFLVERDDRLGDVGMVVGETTKTDPDSDARWVVPTSVKRAVDVAASIARLRLKHFSSANGAPLGGDSLPLALAPTEPWVDPGGHRNSKNELVSQLRFGPFMARFPYFFDPDALSVTEEDWRVAVSMTPNIGNRSGFGVGLPWPLAGHQLRRTTTVNMFASSMVSDASIQWLMKHASPKMSLYYGRNYTNLKLNSHAETAVIVESYKAIYRQLASVVEDIVENVRPHSRDMMPVKIVNLVAAGEEKKLKKLIQKGYVGCRRTLAGFCMNAGSCEYGGIESIAQCAGADGGGICADAIFKRDNEAGLSRLKAAHEKEIESLDSESPRFSALKKEIYAIKVYQDVVND